MAPTLYEDLGSPPCQAVLLTAGALGLTLNHKTVDLQKKDHLKPEYVAINSQHAVPTLTDGSFTVCESRVIQSYLVNKYGGANNTLYPQDVQKRAEVDRLLHFDLGTLYRFYSDYFYEQMFEKKPGNPEKEIKFRDALNILQTFLGDKPYLTGKDYTIADISMLVTLNVIQLHGKFPLNADYPKIGAWIQRLKDNLPTYKRDEAIITREAKRLLLLN